MGTLDSIDLREWQALARGLMDLGLDPGDYTIQVAAIEAPGAVGRALGPIPRKAVLVKHRDGATFRHETYINGGWAGEILQEMLARVARGDL